MNRALLTGPGSSTDTLRRLRAEREARRRVPEAELVVAVLRLDAAMAEAEAKRAARLLEAIERRR